LLIDLSSERNKERKKTPPRCATRAKEDKVAAVFITGRRAAQRTAYQLQQYLLASVWFGCGMSLRLLPLLLLLLLLLLLAVAELKKWHAPCPNAASAAMPWLARNTHQQAL